MAQQTCEPPSLPVGTEVSAKYRGAFCEAKVKTVTRVVKCKVLMKDCQTSVFVTDDEIKGPIKMAAVVEVKHPDTGQPVEATINKLIDNSTYTVVFDDGDERTLRRTQLCLKGDKHFIESETLDNLPLSHPEHFGTPVLQSKKAKRKNGEETDDGDDASEEESPRRTMYRGRHQELVGKLMLIELPQRKGSMLPVLVVLPDANSLSEVKSRDQILVRSFKDSKFMTVTRKDLKEFSRPVAINNEDKTTRAAFEKALLYFDAKELPVGWDREEMLGSDIEDDDSNDFVDEYASEDEPFEEKDRFVAQLYKFMDDRGTPINKGPCIGNKDLNLYKLFKIVQALGGYNKVTKEMKWPVVYSRMSLPSLHQNPAHQIKTAYKKYLDAYETFYRKLGSTMGTLSRPGRVRQNSGRNILNFRGREKSPRSPKTTVEKVLHPFHQQNKEEAEISKAKSEPVAEKCEEALDSASVTSVEDSDVITRRSTPRRENRTQSTKEEKKEENKDKKEDTAKHKKEEKKEESVRVKKEEVTKGKKEDPSSAAKTKKEEAASVTKVKKEDKVKKEEDPVKKEERKSSRKVKVEEDADTEEKKPSRALRKAEEEKKEEVRSDSVTEGKESPKKRITRRKLMQTEVKKEEDAKDESVEVKKEVPKKVVAKDVKVSEKKEKDIPRTLERRDIKLTEKKEALLKEKKETKSADKKMKVAEDKKPQRKEKKGKEGKLDEDDTSSNNNAEEASEGEPEAADRPFHYEYPVGSKLRVKYGRGKNQKIYNAKVVDYGKDGSHMTYLVHYAGWNMRYDEWIRADRVVSVLDKPQAELAKPPVLKQTGTLAGTLKKLGTGTQSILKKTGQIFRAPKTITTKTRATRSSSLETRLVPKKSGKRITRRGSVAASTSDSSENDKSAESQDSSAGVKPDEMTKSKEDEEQDEMDVDVEEEEDVAADVLKEKISTDSEESESVSKEECVYSETGSDKEEEKQEESKEYEVKEERIQKKDNSVGKMESSLSSETCSDSLEEDTEIVIDTDKETEEMSVASKVEKVVGDAEVPEPKAEKVSIAMTEVNTAVDEIRSVVEDENVSHGHDVCEHVEAAEVVKEAEVDEGNDSSKLESNGNALSVSGKEPREASSEVEDVSPQNVSEEGGASTSSEDQGIPQLKKIDLELEGNEKEAEQSKTQKGKKKEGVKDSKRSIRTLDMTGTSLVQEIPTLEPMPLFSEGRLSGKAASSPYDFDAETDSSWHPEITKKWEPTCKAQTPAKDNLSVVVDGDEKEKKKVKKKTKKKPISPEFIVESKGDDVSKGSGESSPAQTMDESGVSQPRADGESEKPAVKKKGRKKKEIAPEAKKEVIQQYENIVNSVVQAVKHIVQKAQDEEEQRPAPKKRKTKRVSESDRKDVKIGRRKNSKDALDSLEDSKEGEPRRTDYVSSSESQTSNESLPAQSQLADVPSSSSFAACEDNLSKADRKDSTFPESQGFEVQLEPHDSNAPFDNTPPTTPEHDEAEEKESGTALHQHHGSNLTAKPDYLKDSAKAVCSSSSSSLSLPTSSGVVQSKSASESPSDNDVISTTSIDNLDSTLMAQQSESSSGTDQDAAPAGKKRKAQEESGVDAVVPKKKKRVHGTRSRTARKSPKYVGSESSMTFKNTDSQVSSSATLNHCPESPPTKFVDFSKSPRSSKYNFSADLGEYLEGEAKCTFLIEKMKEIKSIYMSLKAEVASIDRRRKRARRKEREVSQATSNEREGSS